MINELFNPQIFLNTKNTDFFIVTIRTPALIEKQLSLERMI